MQALSEGYEEGGFVTAMHRAASVAIGGREVRRLNVSLYAGDVDKALDILEQMYEEHDPNMPSLNQPLEEKVLGDEPRYRALLEKMNLPSGKAGSRSFAS